MVVAVLGGVGWLADWVVLCGIAGSAQSTS